MSPWSNILFSRRRCNRYWLYRISYSERRLWRRDQGVAFTAVLSSYFVGVVSRCKASSARQVWCSWKCETIALCSIQMVMVPDRFRRSWNYWLGRCGREAPTPGWDATHTTLGWQTMAHPHTRAAITFKPSDTTRSSALFVAILSRFVSDKVPLRGGDASYNFSPVSLLSSINPHLHPPHYSPNVFDLTVYTNNLLFKIWIASHKHLSTDKAKHCD